MPFGPRLKSIDCADKRQVPQRHCRSKGWMRLRIGLMISPQSAAASEKETAAVGGCSDQQSDFNSGNSLKSFGPYLVVSIKDANRMCKMGARRSLSDNALILQGQRSSIDSGDGDWRDNLSPG
jgi:hypothetical protein